MKRTRKSKSKLSDLRSSLTDNSMQTPNNLKNEHMNNRMTPMLPVEQRRHLILNAGCDRGARLENSIEEKTMSFSELNIDDAPDISQYHFLQSMASPGRTDKTMARRINKFGDIEEAHGDNANDVEMSPDPVSQKAVSPEGSLPSSTC